MTDLVKLGEKTFYIKNPVNVGIYLIDSKNVCLIDTGNSKEFGKIIEKILIQYNWNLKYIINTHSHADHIGGNKYLQTKFKCRIFSSNIEKYFINEPLLEPIMLYGSNPPKEMFSHLLKADASICEDISLCPIKELEILNLSGHSIGQIGIVTDDNVCFIGDAYTSEQILNKYSIQYIYDIKEYLKTLEFLKTTKYNYYVPAHGKVESECKNTIDINIKNVLNIENEIIDTIKDKIAYRDLLKTIFERHHINMNTIQYYLISATIKSFITKLETDKKIELLYKNNLKYVIFPTSRLINFFSSLINGEGLFWSNNIKTCSLHLVKAT